MAEDTSRRTDEIASLRLGLDLGMSLVDTAEMYADGAAEELVGEALAGRRDEAFIVSKVMPQNASRAGTIRACEAGLRRLRTDRIDLYLLHWRGSTPLADTIAGFEALKAAGKIRHWGVSNFDADDMAELPGVPGREACATDQVLYNLTRRGVEFDLLPQCRQAGIPVMAYSPVEQGRMLNHPALAQVAHRHDVNTAVIALAWLLRQDGVVTIPKAGTPSHVRDNRAALDLALTPVDLAALDHAFPPPDGPRALEML